ncbi:MAG TPA: hypothetical protein ENN50_02785 [Prosthecochloris aestuarii]|uniref:Uncharacterized protein n=1 Tax=Prosthecochloris aestuarii TaxID=1102 RepID=A0A831SSP6_PROAE|nr:hypothetical protein [Prosthecochloris aestuarii]
MMKHNACIELISVETGLEADAVARALGLFVRGLVEELLLLGQVCIRGIGCFELRSVPSRHDNGQLIPPAREVVFTSRSVQGNDALRVFRSKAMLDMSTSRKILRLYVSCFRRSAKAGDEFRLEGFGVFRNEGVRYTFVPDRSVHDLFNTGLGILIPLEISSGNKR